MQKFKILILTILLTPVLAGLYGILHDQVTYTISNEYFTKFKFVQFGLVNNGKEFLPSTRLTVAIVGFLATWWTGLIIGIAHALVGLLQTNSQIMQRTIIRAIILTIITTAITGVIGLCYGKFYLSRTEVNWWFPDGLVDKRNFIIVGAMHNFSYLGGAIGLITGIIYQLALSRKIRMPLLHPNRQIRNLS